MNGTTVWSQGSDTPPQVGSLDDMTIINDFDVGLSVVNDRGEVLFHAEPGEPFYDESAVLVDRENGVGYTFTADGTLWAIQSSWRSTTVLPRRGAVVSRAESWELREWAD